MTVPGYERTEEAVTIIACSNALDNDKIRLAFIGKCKKVHALKYSSSSTFTRWFLTACVP
jgi:hypothetical protein